MLYLPTGLLELGLVESVQSTKTPIVSPITTENTLDGDTNEPYVEVHCDTAATDNEEDFLSHANNLRHPGSDIGHHEGTGHSSPPPDTLDGKPSAIVDTKQSGSGDAETINLTSSAAVREQVEFRSIGFLYSLFEFVYLITTERFVCIPLSNMGSLIGKII